MRYAIFVLMLLTQPVLSCGTELEHLVDSFENESLPSNSYKSLDYRKHSKIVFLFRPVASSVEYMEYVVSFKRKEVNRCRYNISGEEKCELVSYKEEDWNKLMNTIKEYIDKNNKTPSMPLLIQ